MALKTFIRAIGNSHVLVKQGELGILGGQKCSSSGLYFNFELTFKTKKTQF